MDETRIPREDVAAEVSRERPPASQRPAGGSRAAEPEAARRRLRALLSSTPGLRLGVLAKEILDPPVALRRRR